MLLVGPAGSGKTRRALEALEKAVGAGRDACLVVPTASMAEHLRHQMARRLGVVSPAWIQSLAGWVEGLTPGVRELPAATETILVERAVALTRVAEFQAVARYPGFHRKLLDTFQEFWAAGAGAADLAARAGESGFTRVMAAYEDLLDEHGAVYRSQRLALAAVALGRRRLDTVVFDGFPNLSAAELNVVAAARSAARSCLVTLPDIGAEDARRFLAGHGFRDTVLNEVRRVRPAPVVVEAPSPEREIEDVAARILADRARTRRPFRDYGVILRNPERYVPIVAVVFERFGIPFRAGVATPLAEHAAVRYLAGLLQAAVDGFDAIETLETLELSGSGLAGDPELDRYDFLVRDRAPGAGVLFLVQAAEGFPRVRAWIARLEELSRWTQERLPGAEWAARCAKLASDWYAPPPLTDSVDRSQAMEWRALAAALDGWRRAAEEAAGLLAGEAGLGHYLRALQAVLRLSTLQPADRRRNVVQVLSVYEARQWEVPVVFVCGLVEKQFPRHHQQNLFFGDGPRQALALRGLRLRTAAELDAEERLLFDAALSRATEQLYLTCPARDEEGAETLASFFLEPWMGSAEPAAPVRLREAAPPWEPASGELRPESLEAAAARRPKFSPSSLEKYIQCPFLFFANHTLRLDGPPATPDQRIDDLLKGTIIHRVIAQWAAAGGDIVPVFEGVFRQVCAAESIQLNFRAEALRMELRADLERFAGVEQERARPAGFTAGGPERDVEYLMDDSPPIRIAGRIDHHEISAAGAVVVVDYKYSAPERIRTICRETEQGLRVQAPLYLLGLEKERGLLPAGMLFYGLRQKPSRRGWVARGLAPDDPDLESLPPDAFREMLESAAGRTMEIVREIRQGSVAVSPRDLGFCREYCRYREVCRMTL